MCEISCAHSGLSHDPQMAALHVTYQIYVISALGDTGSRFIFTALDLIFDLNKLFSPHPYR